MEQAHISRHTHNIKLSQGCAHCIGPVGIIENDVVMDKKQNIGRSRLADMGVIYPRQTLAIRIMDVHYDIRSPGR